MCKNTNNNISVRLCAIAAALVMPAVTVPLAPAASAQNYPSGPVRIIVPYSAGGLADSLGRVTGALVSEALGEPVLVENRPGASSIIGMDACAR